jgi:hypothetical protein
VRFRQQRLSPCTEERLIQLAAQGEAFVAFASPKLLGAAEKEKNAGACAGEEPIVCASPEAVWGEYGSNW